LVDLLILIGACVFLAYVIQSRTYSYASASEGIKKDVQSKIVYYCIVLALILFSGLRSSYNDTSAYIWEFQILETNKINLVTVFEPYGGFDIYQKVIKMYISSNPQVFIFITAIVTNLLYLKFFTAHTRRFCETLFLYLIGNYIFSMAGLKQSIAVAISLLAIDCYMKKQYIKAIIFMLMAMSFHPYIICLLCIPFLKNHLWDRKTILIIIVCILAFMNMDKVFEVFGIIGKDYSVEKFDDYTINPIRVLIEAVPVCISFCYRKKIDRSSNKWMILGLNMRIISFIFIAMGLIVNPIYFGRMSTYFTSLSIIAIPDMLNICWKTNRNGRIYVMGYYLFFFLYFILDMTKIGSISIFYDQFNHIALSSLFARKGIMY